MADDLTPADRVVLARFLRRTLREAKFPMSDANQELRAILDKLAPPTERKPAPPLPCGKSGYLESRKRQRRNRVLP